MTIPAGQLPSYASGTGYDYTHLNNLPDGHIATITVDGRDNNGSIIATSPAVTTTSDRVAPVIDLDLSNLSSQANPTAIVRFMASDAHLASVSCALDSAPALPCSGVATFTGVGLGSTA